MIPTTTTVTNVIVSQSTAGTTYTNAQLGLYSSAGTLLGSSAVQASAGTNGFGVTVPVTLPLTVVGGQSLTITGGEAVFVWAAIHMGSNAATAAIFQGPGASFGTMGVGTTVSTGRAVTATGHATNPLATIGNLTPGSFVNNTSTSLIWMGIS
jgi:nitrous oxidase accessory protein NosD